MNAIRPGLPYLPERMKRLPVDDRGYPVPWFVLWQDGKPEFRVVQPGKFDIAIHESRCWVCGGKLVGEKAFVIGPMCGINRVTAEPPCHRECALFAAIACPFLAIPSAKRREAGLPEEISQPGTALLRNPGTVCVWITRSFEVFRVQARAIAGIRGGQMISLGEPEEVLWFCEGRPAVRAEIWASVESGLPALRALADKDPKSGAHEHIDEQIKVFLPLLPPSGSSFAEEPKPQWGDSVYDEVYSRTLEESER